MSKSAYSHNYLQFGFNNIVTEGIEKPQCVICLKVLFAVHEAFQFKRHFEKKHPTYKDLSFFERKADSVKRSRLDTNGQTFVNIKVAVDTTYVVSLRIANLRNLIVLVKS